MKGKILIVDDEAEFRTLLKANLVDADYAVTEADSAASLQKESRLLRSFRKRARRR